MDDCEQLTVEEHHDQNNVWKFLGNRTMEGVGDFLGYYFPKLPFHTKKKKTTTTTHCLVDEHGQSYTGVVIATKKQENGRGALSDELVLFSLVLGSTGLFTHHMRFSRVGLYPDIERLMLLPKHRGGVYLSYKVKTGDLEEFEPASDAHVHAAGEDVFKKLVKLGYCYTGEHKDIFLKCGTKCYLLPIDREDLFRRINKPIVDEGTLVEYMKYQLADEAIKSNYKTSTYRASNDHDLPNWDDFVTL